MRKELLFLLSSSLLVLFFCSSCQKQPSLLFGNTYTDEGTGANIVRVDTSTVIMSTVFVDSTATAATGFLQVGTYKDDYLGTVTSRAFFQVIPPSSLPDLDPRIATYDSIGLILFAKPGNPYYGDTTVYQNYKVNQIDTLVQLPNGENIWWSNYSLPLGPDLGSASVRISPNLSGQYSSNTSQGTGDTVRIPMDRALGQQLYTMAYNKSDTLITGAKWQNWFHGLCLSPGNGAPANLIYGFKDSAIMRVYYRQNGLLSTGAFIDFVLASKNTQWNNVRTDYTGKATANIAKPTVHPQTPPATTSDKTGHAGYVQTIGGLNVKLTFPFLQSIALRQDYIGLLRATLTVRPVPGSFSTTYRIPPQLGIYQTDQTNLPGFPIPAVGTGGNQSGALVLDYFHPLNTAYTYDVTAFIKPQLTNPSPVASQTGLILSVPTPANTANFNRLIIADQSYPIDQRITLSVYYISLFPHQ